MFDRLRSNWQTLRTSPPGHRFRRYHRARRGERSSPWLRIAMLALGVCIVIVGIILMPAPGPGMLIVAIGAGLLAGESRSFARVLDRAEVVARRLWQRLRGREETPAPQRRRRSPK